MKFKAVILLAIIALASCGEPGEKQKAIDTDPVMASMKRNADSLLLDSKINAVSIGIYKDGKTYAGHYGELDKGKKNQPTDQTLYEIASVSKTFAGTLIAQAELDGKLNLEEDIRKYLTEDYPNLEYKGIPIKIKHLITHTSRLPKFLPDSLNLLFVDIDETLPFKVYEIEKRYNKEKFFADLHSIIIDTIPGTRYDYSNVDTELIAHILENIYKKSYEELLKEYIFDVADMPNTKITLSSQEQLNLATGYGETSKAVPHLVNPLWGAGGGMKSTIPDLLNYMKFQLDEKNLTVKNSHKVLYEGEDSVMGYYWPVNGDEIDGTYYGHHGGALGTQNWFFIIPKHNLGFSIITNQSDQETGGKLIKTVNEILDDIR